MKKLLGIILTSFILSMNSHVSGHEFKGDDYVLILVKGVCNASSQWGVGGSASLYVYCQWTIILTQ